VVISLFSTLHQIVHKTTNLKKIIYLWQSVWQYLYFNYRVQLQCSIVNCFLLPSISSTSYVWIFRTNVHFGSFYCIHVTRKSCWNDIRTKNACILRWWNWHLVCPYFEFNRSIQLNKKRNTKVDKMLKVSIPFFSDILGISVFCHCSFFSKPTLSTEKTFINYWDEIKM